MASQHQLVPRTARAVESLNTAVDQLAGRFGIARPPVLSGRDPELQRVRELESIGSFLASMVALPPSDGDALHGECLRLQSHLDAVTAERDALAQSTTTASKPKTGPSPKPKQGRAQPRA